MIIKMVFYTNVFDNFLVFKALSRKKEFAASWRVWLSGRDVLAPSAIRGELAHSGPSGYFFFF